MAKFNFKKFKIPKIKFNLKKFNFKFPKFGKKVSKESDGILTSHTEAKPGLGKKILFGFLVFILILGLTGTFLYKFKPLTFYKIKDKIYSSKLFTFINKYKNKSKTVSAPVKKTQVVQPQVNIKKKQIYVNKPKVNIYPQGNRQQRFSQPAFQPTTPSPQIPVYSSSKPYTSGYKVNPELVINQIIKDILSIKKEEVALNKESLNIKKIKNQLVKIILEKTPEFLNKDEKLKKRVIINLIAREFGIPLNVEDVLNEDKKKKKQEQTNKQKENQNIRQNLSNNRFSNIPLPQQTQKGNSGYSSSSVVLPNIIKNRQNRRKTINLSISGSQGNLQNSFEGKLARVLSTEEEIMRRKRLERERELKAEIDRKRENIESLLHKIIIKSILIDEDTGNKKVVLDVGGNIYSLSEDSMLNSDITIDSIKSNGVFFQYKVHDKVFNFFKPFAINYEQGHYNNFNIGEPTKPIVNNFRGVSSARGTMNSR